ncbi:MAG: Omp28-related outer membrane protein [Bacteroidia bacterium]|nr:Omp28-related outer membrane protein [Bacteroidia bacterium]NNJ56723.1 Omp28-related outer membrane protein [Bacteroidia bacterium]
MIKQAALIAFLFLAFGCKESNPPIDFGKAGVTLLNDTCYTLATQDIPSADYRAILVEDITGVRCVNCPQAAKAAKHIQDTMEMSDVFILGLYPQQPLNLTTPASGFEDLRNATSQLIGSNIYEFSNQLPAGGVNRKQFSGQTSIRIPYSLWENSAKTLDGTNAIVNLELNKLKLNDSTFQVKSKSSFIQKPEQDVFITVLLLEDGILHPQYTLTGTDQSYIHKHVLREAFTPYNGVPLSGPDCLDIDRGVVVEKGWEVVIPEYVNKANASILVFLNYNDASNKEVLQCTEIKLN